LQHLCTHQAEVRFKLPPLQGIQVQVTRADGSEQTLDALADTLRFPETNACSTWCAWRRKNASRPCRLPRIALCR
jgi:hypothetical protein